jgi:hypothetical protein
MPEMTSPWDKHSWFLTSVQHMSALHLNRLKSFGVFFCYTTRRKRKNVAKGRCRPDTASSARDSFTQLFMIAVRGKFRAIHYHFGVIEIYKWNDDGNAKSAASLHPVPEVVQIIDC